jgi:hypothetical protein
MTTRRRRRLERRGRPRKANARRRKTTLAGRAAPADEGSSELVIRKRRAANGGGSAVELVDISGILHAHGLVDIDQIMVLRMIEEWLRRVRIARGINPASPGGLWAAIVSGQRGSRKWTVPVTSPSRRTGGDMAWFRIVQLHNAFAAAHELDRLALLMNVAAGDRAPQA